MRVCVYVCMCVCEKETDKKLLDNQKVYFRLCVCVCVCVFICDRDGVCVCERVCV